jgi:hypothetical protein
VGLRRGTFAALALAQALGCAKDLPRETTVLAGNWARTIVILPLNVAAVMPPELETASAVVWEELERYLRAQGKELKTVAFPAARQLWLNAIHGARTGEKGGKAGFDDAARLLVLELARHADFEAVIVPSLFVRAAPISGRSARWDGVERPLDFERRGPGAWGAEAPPEVEGVAPAASLHAVVFDAQGSKLQEELRGLDLLVRVRVTETKEGAPPGFDYEPRLDPFTDRARVRDAIAEALAPFLPRLSPGSDGAPP